MAIADDSMFKVCFYNLLSNKITNNLVNKDKRIGKEMLFCTQDLNLALKVNEVKVLVNM